MQILLAIFLGLAGQTAGQQKAEYDPDDALRGLGKFRVVVADMDADSPVTKSQLQTDIELRLRSLGIEIRQSGNPYLYVNVQVVGGCSTNCPGYCYVIKVAVFDRALLRSGTYFGVEVWAEGSMGSTPCDNASKDIRDTVKDHVDVFANAWLKTHPKKAVNDKATGKKEP